MTHHSRSLELFVFLSRISTFIYALIKDNTLTCMHSAWSGHDAWQISTVNYNAKYKLYV